MLTLLKRAISEECKASYVIVWLNEEKSALDWQLLSILDMARLLNAHVYYPRLIHAFTRMPNFAYQIIL